MHKAVKFAAALVLVAAVFPVRNARAELPTLERTIALAQTRALQVAEAQSELGIANAQMVGSRVSVFGNPYTEVQIDKGLQTGQQLQAMSFTYFPVDLTGQRGARIEEAERFIEWRKRGVIDARASVTGEAVATYGAYVIGASRVAQAVSGEQTAREEAKYFAGRLDAKDTTVYEKALADAEVARWVQSRAEAELKVTQARARIGELTGLPMVEVPPEGTPVTLPVLRGTWDDAYIAKIVDRTPAITRLAAERAYWESSSDRYKAERIAPFIFEFIGGRGAAGETRLGGGLVFTFPVTRRYQGEIARAESGVQSSQNRLALFRGVVTTRLRAARDATRSIRKAIDELDAAGIPAMEKAVSSSVDAFKLGKIELTRVLLARRDLALARTRRLDLLEVGWRAYADLTIFSGELP